MKNLTHILVKSHIRITHLGGTENVMGMRIFVADAFERWKQRQADFFDECDIAEFRSSFVERDIEGFEEFEDCLTVQPITKEVYDAMYKAFLGETFGDFFNPYEDTMVGLRNSCDFLQAINR